MLLPVVLHLIVFTQNNDAHQVPAVPASITTVDLTASSFTIKWSFSSGNATENKLALNFTVCVRESDTMVNGSLFTCNEVNNDLDAVNGSLEVVNTSLANGSQTHRLNCQITLGHNCSSIGDFTLYTMTELTPRTEYVVSVIPQTYHGFGPESVTHVSTLQDDSRMIYVELLSRIESDILYDSKAQSYSSITVKGQRTNFDQHGMHFIVLHPNTGSQLMQGSFNTHDESESSTQMEKFLSTVPKPSIILMVVYYQAHDYYTPSTLQPLCPNALSSYTKLESWCMICMYGFGTMPWIRSLTSNGDKGPAEVNTHILLPKELESAPDLTNVIATSSQTLHLSWTAPVTSNYTGEISYYQICYKKSSDFGTSNCSLASVRSNLTQAKIDGLHPYQDYAVRIRGVVAMGYGPYSNVLLATTDEAAPDGPPTDARVTDVQAKTMSLSWLPPKPELRNGVIVKYTICIRIYSHNPGPCLREIMLERQTEYRYTVVDLKPYTKYVVQISAGTVVGMGPHVSLENETLQAAPSGPPTNLHVTNFTHNEINITWSPPDPEKRNGVITKYHLCLNNETYSIHCLHRTIVKAYQTSYTFRNLRPYRRYTISIRAGTKWLGSHGVIAQRTAQAEPSSGPTNVEFPRVTSSSILVTWSQPAKEDRNGVILHYGVCFQSFFNYKPCINYTTTTHASFELSGLKPHRAMKFAIKAATIVGYGPPTVRGISTHQEAPDGPPTDARVTDVQAKTMSLSWLPPKPELRNGVIVKYTICIRVYSHNPGPCLREIMLERRTEYRYTVVDLKPYTKYVVQISAGTVIGMGPHVSLENETLQAAPSGPPTNLHVTNFTHDEINVTWSPPDPEKRNGVITKYHLCLNNETYSIHCLHGTIVEAYQTSYTFRNLRPYRRYTIRIRAGTKWLGSHGVITQRTAQAEPDGPPTEKLIEYVDDWTISFSWSAPHPDLQNGIIIYYDLCIREYGPDFSCVRSERVAESEENSYAFGGLKPKSEYVVILKAATIIGLGPPAFIQKTAGECDLPIFRAGGFMNDNSFRASGFLGRRHGPSQARFDSNFAWCDSGLKSDAYVQVDFDGPLRVIGVASRQQQEHWGSWVTSYQVSHSLNGMEWSYVKVNGSTVIDGNADTIAGREVTHFIDEPVFARFFRFQVRSFVGIHPCMSVQVFGCAPAMKPSTISIVDKSAVSIEVSWPPLPSQVNNGRIHGYRVCHKLASSDLPSEKSCFVSRNATSYLVQDLTPYTQYDIEISARTMAGYGPAATLSARTNESIPSGPPHKLWAQEITTTSVTLAWIAPQPHHRNGIIVVYGICYQEATLRTECTDIRSIPGGQLSYKITAGLRPYCKYKFVVMAATMVEGWSPKAMHYETTREAVPSGPPTSLRATRIGARMLQVFWKPPEPRKQNGDIVGYRFCIKEKHSSFPCRDHITLTGSPLLSVHTVGDLEPFTVYSIHVEARTALGYGPGQYLDYRTGEAAPTAPPRNVKFKSVTSSSIQITWLPPDPEKQNGVIAMYEVEVYQETSGMKLEIITRSLMHADTTVWKISKLGPRTEYVFHIRAGTAGGYGPAVVVHKRSEGRFLRTGKSRNDEGKLTARSITGGSILLVVMIVSLIVSVLWNKGMIPGTRTRKMILRSEKDEARRRGQRGRRKGYDGVDFDDYSPKKRQQEVTSEELYNTRDIYPSGTNSQSQDISPSLPNQNIYAPSRTDINGTADISEKTLTPGGHISAGKSQHIIPPVIPGPSVLSLVIPVETTLSSTFIKLSSTTLNDPASASKNAKTSSRSNSPKNQRPKDKRDKNTRSKSPKSAFVISQSSKSTPVITKRKITPVLKVDSSVPRTNTSEITPSETFQPSLIENNHNSPKIPVFTINDPETETVIKSFYDSGEASGSETNIAGSDLVPVSLFRRTPSPNPLDHPILQSSALSSIATLRGNDSSRRKSANYHPNMPRYSIDFSAKDDLVNAPVRTPSFPKFSPIPHPPKNT